MDSREALEETLANAEEWTSESPVTELENTGSHLGDFVDLHQLKSIEFHFFANFFTGAEETMITDERENNSTVSGIQSSDPSEIDAG